MASKEYEQYEQACKKIEKDNALFLADFEKWLSAKGLAKKTIKRHEENVDFYINTFLLHEEAVPAKDGAGNASYFLGYWFIRKAMWASPASIKQNAASLKKLYTYMHQRGQVDADDLQNLKEAIKEEMSEWVATLERYDDPDITDSEEIWGL